MTDYQLYSLAFAPEARRAFKQIGINLGFCISSLLVPALLLYFSLYALAKRETRKFEVLSLLASVGFVVSSCLVVLECNMIRSLQLFAVAIGVMKALDLFARRYHPPQYAQNPIPGPGLLALLYLTELRYESFTPNTTRLGPAPAPSPQKGKGGNYYRNGRSSPKSKQWKPHFSEPVNLVLHAALFAILQTLFPQSNPTVVALEVLLAIYVIWETLQLMLRYHTSPPVVWTPLLGNFPKHLLERNMAQRFCQPLSLARIWTDAVYSTRTLRRASFHSKGPWRPCIVCAYGIFPRVCSEATITGRCSRENLHVLSAEWRWGCH
ncbi:hypothetical protein BDDG_01307 [Blastomyces dermatitidis ATCC 18188]|uniref:Wax synthase domain-containing protein n=1 Tax=Ajellomyces dermatitidis (strain ATCC 18188 / CBS 674.68) TaxID=653446 RepID=F2T5E5_AJEDA|nr:hypothetical protein BDDG_01307 [Blastomyces dermatitidis ATCC 18188]